MENFLLTFLALGIVPAALVFLIWNILRMFWCDHKGQYLEAIYRLLLTFILIPIVSALAAIAFWGNLTEAIGNSMKKSIQKSAPTIFLR